MIKAGCAWTRKNEKTNKLFIPIVFDETFLELCPQLKNCKMVLNHIEPEDRKSDKSPGWYLYLASNDEKSSKKQDNTEAEQAIKEDAEQAAQTPKDEDNITEEGYLY